MDSSASATTSSTLSQTIELGMRDAIAYLSGALSCSPSACLSHSTVIVTDLENDEGAREAIARYLVGIRASAIDAALNIKADLEDTDADREEILRSVIEIVKVEISDSQAARPEWVIKERDPWISEGIWHLLMAIAATRQDLHPPGLVLLLGYPHVKAKDHGFDVCAVYDDNGLFGFTIIESKAHRDNLNSAISDAAEFFRQVRQGVHDTRIRQEIQIMRTALSPTQNYQISSSCWKRKRAYIFNPHYSLGPTPTNWNNPRPTLADLSSTIEQVLVMPNQLQRYDDFFNDIANRMRRYAEGL